MSSFSLECLPPAGPMPEPSASQIRIAALPTHAWLDRTARLPAAEAAGLCRQQRPRPLVVIDTNVWLDILYWHDALATALERAWRSGAVTAAVTHACLVELADVIVRSKFAIAPEGQIRMLQQVLDGSLLVAPCPACGIVCKDADDVKFLDLAVAVRADALITKDKVLLRAGRRLRRLGCQTVTPARFATTGSNDPQTRPA